jgi:hypothetical protein
MQPSINFLLSLFPDLRSLHMEAEEAAAQWVEVGEEVVVCILHQLAHEAPMAVIKELAIGRTVLSTKDRFHIVMN